MATIHPTGGSVRTLRIAAGHWGKTSFSEAEESAGEAKATLAEPEATLAEAEAALVRRARAGARIVLRGWDGPGLIIGGDRVRAVRLSPCDAGSAERGESGDG